MRNILHDWSDQAASVILRNLRAAMGRAAATLAVVEASKDPLLLFPSFALMFAFRHTALAACVLLLSVPTCQFLPVNSYLFKMLSFCEVSLVDPL